VKIEGELHLSTQDLAKKATLIRAYSSALDLQHAIEVLKLKEIDWTGVQQMGTDVADSVDTIVTKLAEALEECGVIVSK
jgi:transcription initiation factor IIF auxiliary subunit